MLYQLYLYYSNKTHEDSCIAIKTKLLNLDKQLFLKISLSINEIIGNEGNLRQTDAFNGLICVGCQHFKCVKLKKSSSINMGN